MSSTTVVEQLRAAGCVFAEDEAALLTEAASGERLAALVARRVAGEPLEHLLGYVDFDGVRYRLSPGVFITRQRSGLLVERAGRHPAALVVDLCCGCGALGLATARRIAATGRRPRLIAADLSSEAVADARANGVDEAYLGDLFEALPGALRGAVDLLLVNAPYVPTTAIADMPAESRDHEPRGTVDGGEDGMRIQERVLAQATGWLRPDGVLLTETSTAQAEALRAIATGHGFDAEIVHDDERGATVLEARPAAQSA